MKQLKDRKFLITTLPIIIYISSPQYDKVAIFTVNTDKTYEEIEYTDSLGIRPLIVISKNYFN